MIAKKFKEKIRELVDFHTTVIQGKPHTDEYWDSYFKLLDGKDVKQIIEGNALIAYLDDTECLGMIEYVFECKKSAFKVYRRLLEKSKKLGKPIRGHIHISNVGMLNTAFKAGFRIIGTTEKLQYLVERRV